MSSLLSAGEEDSIFSQAAYAEHCGATGTQEEPMFLITSCTLQVLIPNNSDARRRDKLVRGILESERLKARYTNRAASGAREQSLVQFK